MNNYCNDIINSIDEKCIILKIKQDFINKYNGNIYEASRHEWRLNIKNANKADIVLISFNGIIEEVYTNLSWYKENNRLSFAGVQAQESIRSKYYKKRIPSMYITNRSKNPCKYINIL